MTRKELYERSLLGVKEPYPDGDAWMFIMELTVAGKSDSWIRTKLNQAANDSNIHTVKRRIYREASVALLQKSDPLDTENRYR